MICVRHYSTEVVSLTVRIRKVGPTIFVIARFGPGLMFKLSQGWFEVFTFYENVLSQIWRWRPLFASPLSPCRRSGSTCEVVTIIVVKIITSQNLLFATLILNLLLFWPIVIEDTVRPVATFQLVSKGGHQPDRAVKQKLSLLKLCQVLKVFKSWSPVKRMSDNEKAPKSFHLCQFPEESNMTKKQTRDTNTMSPELRVREPRSNLPSLGGWRVWMALSSCC